MKLDWGRGPEGQRKADRGDGTFLNPILAGDHPDPTILKDGDDYYLTFSSFLACPGIVIWHSQDLVNWAPVGRALATDGPSLGNGPDQASGAVLHLPTGQSSRSRLVDLRDLVG